MVWSLISHDKWMGYHGCYQSHYSNAPMYILHSNRRLLTRLCSRITFFFPWVSPWETRSQISCEDSNKHTTIIHTSVHVLKDILLTSTKYGQRVLWYATKGTFQ